MHRSQPPAPGGRQGVELADVVRQWLDHGGYLTGLVPVQQQALQAIQACRTAVLGAAIRVCGQCGSVQVRYHSCRNRHCPKCQTLAKERWLAARMDELLPIPYFHLVFTLPHGLNPLVQGNLRPLYTLLFHSVAATLREFGHNPRWLGGELGFTLVLHTWDQTLSQHVHLHAIVTGGALAQPGRWQAARPGFLFPIRALSRVFRGKFIAGLKQLRNQGGLRYAGQQAPLADQGAFNHFLEALYRHDWVVYAKPAFAGPAQVLEYLGRYTHRVAIANHRLIAIEDGHVRFTWRDRAHGNKLKTTSLTLAEFMRRFLLHILPPGLMRIRHYGMLANRHKRRLLQQCRLALQQPAPAPREPESVAAMLWRVLQIDITRCPVCRTGELHPFPRLPNSTGPPVTHVA